VATTLIFLTAGAWFAGFEAVTAAPGLYLAVVMCLPFSMTGAWPHMGFAWMPWNIVNNKLECIQGMACHHFVC
jgi:hypothetical protein